MACGAGIQSKGIRRCQRAEGAIETQPGSHNFIMQPSEGIVDVPDWMATGYLVLMRAKHGGKAPAGDLAFVIVTKKGVRQLVTIQCRKHASNDTVRLGPLKNVYDDLQGCVDR